MNTRKLEVRFEESPEVEIPLGGTPIPPSQASQPRWWLGWAFQNRR